MRAMLLDRPERQEHDCLGIPGEPGGLRGRQPGEPDHCIGVREAGADRGWPEKDAAWLRGARSTRDATGATRLRGARAWSRRSLFEQAVGAQAKRVRNREAKRLCGLEVDDQLEARRPFDRQIGRLGTLEDPVDEER